MPLFLVSIKQEKEYKHNGVFSQCVMKNGCKDELQLLFIIIANCDFFFLRFLNFYLCGKLENTALHKGPSHS